MALKKQRLSLEIDVHTLRRLLAHEQLNVREFHCVDHSSKNGVQKILLNMTARRL